MKALAAAALVFLAGCASTSGSGSLAPGMSESDVTGRLGKPVAAGRLASGEEYRDYSKQPFGYRIDRVTFSSDGRLREARNLLTEENFKNLREGMTPEEVEAVVGPSYPLNRRAYAGGTKSWSYRYYDYGVTKLLNVIFNENDRVIAHYTEWDPTVYSKGGSRSKGGK